MKKQLQVNSVGVVVTFANRDPRSIVNLVSSLAGQTRPPEAMVLVNFGPPCPELESLEAPFQYIYRHLPQGDLWSLPVAANQGVRLLPPVESLLFLDADVMLAPDFIESGMAHLKPGTMINCRILDLPQGAVPEGTDVVRDFARLKALATPRAEITAVGACQWVRTKAFEAIRGHDEGFMMWCFEDMDFQRRARWLGLQPVHLDEETAMLHQWHPSKDDIIVNGKDPVAVAARRCYRANLERLRTRALFWDLGKFRHEDVNPNGWGRLAPKEASAVR